jgi:hypothetical protein
LGIQKRSSDSHFPGSAIPKEPERGLSKGDSGNDDENEDYDVASGGSTL